MKTLDYLQNFNAGIGATLFVREGRRTPQGIHCTYIVEVEAFRAGEWVTRETREFTNDYEGARRFLRHVLPR